VGGKIYLGIKTNNMELHFLDGIVLIILLSLINWLGRKTFGEISGSSNPLFFIFFILIAGITMAYLILFIGGDFNIVDTFVKFKIVP
jgi:hypothetical protein